MKGETVFTKIIKRKIPAYIVAEDKAHIAFLDIFPVALGHTLVVPKTVVDDFFDLRDDLLSSLVCFAKKVSKKIAYAIPCLRVGLKVYGLDVAHAHMHLIPIFDKESFAMSQPMERPSPEEMRRIADHIKAC